MPDFNWFAPLTEDDTDPACPLFWETVHFFAKQGEHLTPPDVELPEPGIGVKVLELTREVALKTPTQLMPTLESA